MYEKWEDLFLQAEKLEQPGVKRAERVVYSGMGGSGIAGDMVNLLNPQFDYTTAKALFFPPKVGKDTLFIAVSYSGNTKETLQAFAEAQSRGARCVAVTSGGALAEEAEKKSVPIVRLPGGMQPRVAFPLILVPVLRLLNETFSMGYNIHELYEGVMASKGDRVEPKSLAGKIGGKIPVIYGSRYISVAKRFKQQFNENAKYPAFYGDIPEIFHNELEGYKRGNALFPILIRDNQYDDVANEILGTYVVRPKFQSVLKNISSLVYFADLTSIHFANMLNEDPYSINTIRKAKNSTNKIL